MLDEVAFGLHCRVLYEGTETLPGGLFVADPVHLELNLLVILFVPHYSNARDFVNAVPAVLLLRTRLRFWLRLKVVLSLVSVALGCLDRPLRSASGQLDCLGNRHGAVALLQFV